VQFTWTLGRRRAVVTWLESREHLASSTVVTMQANYMCSFVSLLTRSESDPGHRGLQKSWDARNEAGS